MDTTGWGEIVDQFEKMPECTDANEGETTSVTMSGSELNYICKDGEWEIDNSCTEEGATKEMDAMGMIITYTCTDGQWRFGIENIGIGNWGAGDSSISGWGEGGWGNGGFTDWGNRGFTDSTFVFTDSSIIDQWQIQK